MAQTHMKEQGELGLFKNDDTRERWQWVQRAIDHAKVSSDKHVLERSENTPRTAASPFDN